jgi:hypothetical protein
MSYKLDEYASLYHSFGFNVICIEGVRTVFNNHDNNLLKAPSHEWERWQKEIQSSGEVSNLPWSNAVGLGIILGYNSVMAIDIDGVLDFSFVRSICQFLGLPSNYPWIVKSGSRCGYHIILQCSDLREEGPEKKINGKEFILASGSEYEPPFGGEDTNAYYPPLGNRLFNKIEFKWRGNLVLPPSIHVTANLYDFIDGIPSKPPSIIEFDRLSEFKRLHCSLQSSSSEHRDYEDAISSCGEYYDQRIISTYLRSHFIAQKDEINFNFSVRRKESALLFSLLIYGIADDENYSSTNPPNYLVQISWYVIDKNNNVVKRKTFNYISQTEQCQSVFSTLPHSITKKVVENKRYIYHELMFDLLHVNSIISIHSDNIQFIKAEIHQCGLYADVLLKDSPNGVVMDGVLHNEKYTCAYDCYKKEFLKEADCQLNSISQLQIYYCLYLKNNGVEFNIPNFSYEKRKLGTPDNSKFSHDGSDNYYEKDNLSYDNYGGAYGFDDDTIDDAFEGDPENYWNID